MQRAVVALLVGSEAYRSLPQWTRRVSPRRLAMSAEESAVEAMRAGVEAFSAAQTPLDAGAVSSLLSIALTFGTGAPIDLRRLSTQRLRS